MNKIQVKNANIDQLYRYYFAVPKKNIKLNFTHQFIMKI